MAKTVEIPEEIYEKLLKRVGNMPEIENVDSYVVNILKQVIERLEAKQEKPVYSKEDEEKVKERLKSLGYLD